VKVNSEHFLYISDGRYWAVPQSLQIKCTVAYTTMCKVNYLNRSCIVLSHFIFDKLLFSLFLYEYDCRHILWNVDTTKSVL
jgi:hypothetical protein